MALARAPPEFSLAEAADGTVTLEVDKSQQTQTKFHPSAEVRPYLRSTSSLGWPCLMLVQPLAWARELNAPLLLTLAGLLEGSVVVIGKVGLAPVPGLATG